jgi:hypothetical protein
MWAHQMLLHYFMSTST